MRNAPRLCALILGACAATPGGRGVAPPAYEDDPAARAGLLGAALDGYRAAFVLTWNGERIGEARERFYAAPDAEGGYRFERTERVVLRRAGAVSTAQTRISIDLDLAMSARRVRVDRDNGHGRVQAQATRNLDEGWRITYGASPPRLVDGAAVPSTLIPLLVAADGAPPGAAWQGPVLVEGAGLAHARLAVLIDADGRTAHAVYDTAAGPLRAEAVLDDRGFIAEAGVGAAVQSRRATEEELAADFTPPEVVDASAVTVAGAVPDAAGSLRLSISGVKAPPPILPELPDQAIALRPGGTWDVTVEPTPRPRRGTDDDVRERTSWVSRRLADDLQVAALTPEEALAAGRGDCTAHALVLERELDDRGYDARLVTGFILDDGMLRRHRWVIVRVGADWLPVDPMFDEVPASPAHLALAIHGASPDELAFIDDVAFAGWSTATATPL